MKHYTYERSESNGSPIPRCLHVSHLPWAVQPGGGVIRPSHLRGSGNAGRRWPTASIFTPKTDIFGIDAAQDKTEHVP